MRFLLVAMGLSLIATAALAEETPLAPGARIRVTLLERRTEPIVGTLLALPPGTIEFEDSLARSIPRGIVATLEVSRGMKAQTGKYALIGGILGGVAATTFGYIMGSSATSDEEGPATLGGGFGAAGILIGAGFGAIIGSGTKVEKWEEVALP